MTKQEVHEALCNMPDQQKMNLAVACQVNGVSVEQLEETIANLVTGAQTTLAPALRDYKYLGGGQ